MNTPRHRRQGRGLHRAAAIGSLLVLGQSAYAETKAAAAEEGVQEMPERVMTIRSRSLRAETVSSATLTNMKTEEVPQTVNVITRDLMDSKGSDSLVEALRMDSSVNTGGDMLLSRTADQYTIRGFAGSDVQIGNMPLPRGMGYGMDTSLIENIEIVKGPIGSISGGQTSTLGAYGAGGSINLILKEPDFLERTELTAYARLSHHGQKYRATIDDTRYRGDETNGFALRTVVAAEYERPFWLSNGANGGQKYTVSPIFRWQHDSRTKTVLTTSFQYQNSPTTMGIPVLGGDKDDVWAIRPYVLECADTDPLTGVWTEKGKMGRADADEFSFEAFSLDATVFENKGKHYYVWAEKVGVGKQISNLYIGEMETPYKLKTVQVLLTSPDYDWERVGFWVNEGPAVIHHDGRIYLTYSASETGAAYCMGMLAADEDSDLLDPKSWTKERYPVLRTDESRGIYGPGHNSFTEDEEGNPVMVYHARTEAEIEGNPLYNPNRHAMLMKIRWDEKTGAPIFSYED